MLIPFGVLSAAGAGGGGPVAGAYELISTTILSSNQASVVFDVSTYTSTYKHLQVRYVARDSGTYGVLINTTGRFNGTTTNYRGGHYLGGDGSTAVSGDINDSTRLYPGTYYGAGVANLVGSGVIDILDAFSTTKNKTVRTLSGVATGGVYLTSALWMNTAAITSFEIFSTGTSFGTSSRFSIYGIKG